MPLPGGGTRRERSDLLGRPVLQEEPDGSWLRFRYAADGRLRQVEHSSGERIDYDFDVAARTWRARTGRTETTIRLSTEDLPAELALCVDGRTWTVGYERDERGQATAWRYPQSVDWARQERTAGGGLTMGCGERWYCRLTPEPGRPAMTAEYATGARTREELEAEGPPYRPARVTVVDAAGQAVVDAPLEHGPHGRLANVGGHAFAYDDEGRLAADRAGGVDRSYAYDTDGRLVESRGPDGTRTLEYGDGPTVARADGPDGRSVRFAYDQLGRRVERRGPDGVTRYAYNLFGLLERVELPDGRVVEYLYDGFGRLVGRHADGTVEYYVVGLEGERLAEADAEGHVRASYLWLGRQCVGRVDGPLGGPLASTFHRVHGGWLAAVGDAAGAVVAQPHGEAFGLDAPLEAGRPGYAGLFGDPATGLLLASSRWLDPGTAQFLTPDSWFGADPARGLPPGLRRVLGAIPGGTRRLITAPTAYAWSAYDPINFSDPSGHNWLGLIYSFISAHLWEMQLTSLALQMEAINILVDPFSFIGHAIAGNLAGYWKWSIFNLAPPVASYRLMVPFAFLLNGVLKIHAERAWTLGSVIWERGSELRELAARAKRDVLICSNAATYVAKADQVPADVFRARSPNVRIGGTVAAIGTAATDARIDPATVNAPVGEPLRDVLENRDWVSVRRSGAAAPTEELRSVSAVTATAVRLDGPPLPAAFAGVAVDVVRLDRAIVRMQKAGAVAARTVRFTRGNSFHFSHQVREGFPTDGLDVAEYMPAGRRNTRHGVAFPVDAVVVRLPQATDLTGYAAGNLVRLLAVPSGAPAGTLGYHARKVAAVVNGKDLLLDAPLATATYASVEVVRLDSADASVAAQAAGGPLFDRVGVTGLPNLRRLDALEIHEPAAPAAIERRIVTNLLLDCSVDALPNALHNVAIKIDRLVVDGGPSDGAMQGATGRQISVTTAGASFDARAPVAVTRTSDGRKGVGVVDSFSGGVLRLVEALTAADFGDGVAVRVDRLAAVAELGAEGVTPPGDHLFVQVDRPNALGANEILRIRPASEGDGGAVRRLAAAPVPLAQLDAALPPSHRTNLTLQRFAPDEATRRTNGRMPTVRRRLTLAAGDTNLYAQGQELHVSGGEEAVVKVDRPPAGQDVILSASVELPADAFPMTVDVSTVSPTGKTTPDGRLDEGMVLIPSESDRGELLTRREALEHHEMRHVWQGAVWGPFIIALPIPWLLHVGWSFGPVSHSRSQVVRHIGLGGIDTLFALVAWGIKGGDQAVTVDGRVSGADRKRIVLAESVAPDVVRRFSKDSRIEIKKEDDFFNIVDALDEGARTITLRFELEQPPFADGDAVRVFVSPFEQVRKVVSTVFGNLEQLWSDHIPQAWGRALSRLLNRDSWFPFLGIYLLIGIIQVGSKEHRLPNEQDAAYHSGDLYTDLAKADPNEIFVGHFTKAWAFIQARTGGLAERGGGAGVLRVALPAGATAADVGGAIPTDPDSGFTPARDCVRFQESHFMDLDDRIENAVGAFFVPSREGTYHIRPPETTLYDEGLAFPKFAFAVGFFDLAQVTVKALPITPDPAQPIFETETVPFAIRVGDAKVSYELRFPPGGGATLGTLDRLRYTAPVLTAAGPAAQDLHVFATFKPDHPIFFVGEDETRRNVSRLSEAQRTNLCQVLRLTIESLTAPAVGPVRAGASQEFQVPIAPAVAMVTSPTPAGAAVNASVQVIRPGRPATLRFIAPNAVTAASDVTVRLQFGSDPDPAKNKAITITVRVEPAT